MIEKLLEDKVLGSIYEQLIAHDIFDVERTQRLILHIHDHIEAKAMMEVILERFANNVPIIYETTVEIEKM